METTIINVAVVATKKGFYLFNDSIYPYEMMNDAQQLTFHCCSDLEQIKSGYYHYFIVHTSSNSMDISEKVKLIQAVSLRLVKIK